jgi:hypothetical protein
VSSTSTSLAVLFTVGMACGGVLRVSNWVAGRRLRGAGVDGPGVDGLAFPGHALAAWAWAMGALLGVLWTVAAFRALQRITHRRAAGAEAVAFVKVRCKKVG